jgi:hypothetical protein
MPLLPSASDSEPVLILTDQEFQRAFTPEAPPVGEARQLEATRPVPPAPKAARLAKPRPAASIQDSTGPEQRYTVLRNVAAAAVVLVLVGAGGLAWLEFTSKPVESPAVAGAPPKPVVKAPERPPELRQAPVPPVIVSPIPEPEPVEEAPKPEPAPAAPAPPWNGGRAWVEVSLHMEYKGSAQDLRRKVVVVWDGSQFIVERPATGRPEAWMQRLELLLQLPQVGDSWPRHVSKVSRDFVACPDGTVPAERVDGEDRFPQETRRFTYWTTPDFGAGAIRAAVAFPDVSMEFRVLAFGPEPGASRKP